MFLWDRMLLSKILDFVKIIEEDCPLGAVASSNSRIVFGNFSFIFPYVFPLGDISEMMPFIQFMVVVHLCS